MLIKLFSVMLVMQLLHSAEELSQGFHKRFSLFKMSFRFFLIFEIVFYLFWVSVLIVEHFPFRDYLMGLFILLMLINGLWHMIWWGVERKYVPGQVFLTFGNSLCPTIFFNGISCCNIFSKRKL